MTAIDFKKQFYVFSFPDYYPSGGLADVCATYDSLEDAKKAITDESTHISSSNCYVWDKVSGEIVFDLYE